MKSLATILSFILIIALIPACEESPEVPEIEDKFLSLIPGEYKCRTDVRGEPNDELIRRIPELFRYTVDVLRIKENHYALFFRSKDSILPTNISGEITVFQEQFGYCIFADFRVLENELFKQYIDTSNHSINSSTFIYSYLEHKIIFNLSLTNKTQDSIYLNFHGERQY